MGRARAWHAVTAATRTSPPPLGVPTAPPLPADLEALARRLRLPHLRRCAPEIIATAKAQRWDPTEVLKAVLVEEAAGRERSALATRRAAAGFPTGKTFHAWTETASSIPAPTQPRYGPWNGSTAARTWSSAAHRGPVRRTSSRRWAQNA